MCKILFKEYSINCIRLSLESRCYHSIKEMFRQIKFTKLDFRATFSRSKEKIINSRSDNSKHFKSVSEHA